MTDTNKYIAGGGGGCFTGDTPVSIPGGTKLIKEISVGDIVCSFDDKGTIYHAKVLKVHEHENEPVTRYAIWGGKDLDATPNHWVLNQFNAFVGIGTLKTDDCLVDEFGHLRPIVKRTELGEHTVYNLTVEGHHTFIANTIRVHNAGLGPSIAGSGGGRGRKGGGGSPPSITPDNLHSQQFATLVDLISEGEIEGFATASKEGRTKGTSAYLNASLKDIFLDNTPILQANADSTDPSTVDFNHKNVTFDVRFGTTNQTQLQGLEGSSSVFNVGVEAKKGVSNAVTRQLTNNTELDAVRVTITVPSLQEQREDGDVVGSQVTFEIQIQNNGGGFTTKVTDTIQGRTADAYNRDYRINLSGSHPIDVRVVKTSDDSTDRKSRDLIWQSYSELIDDSNTYPDSAYTKLRLDSEFFTRIPSRKFKIRGIKVRIPGAGASGSGTPTVDLQTGRVVYPTGYIFNGVMGAAQWTTCPALILLDLLTDTRYGLGNHIVDSNLDLFSFVTASKFSNELVDDGFNGQEARFACNINIQTSVEAFDVINTLSGIMRCMPIWAQGALQLTQDSPRDPNYLFTMANVGAEGFSYTGSSLKTRSTVVAVSYFNMDIRDIDYEEVEAETAYKNKYGLHLKRVKALGCTSRGQARRFAKAILFSEQRETEVVTFSTSMESGIIVRPGTIISIADPARSGVRRAGRINSATTTQITVDNSDATDLSTASNPKLSVIMPDGTVENKNVTGISGKVITLESALSAAPNVNSVWMLENDSVSSQQFRVMSVEERDGINYAISALAYVNAKYAFIEDGVPIPAQRISTLNIIKEPPNGLSAEEKIVVINNQPVSKLIIRWQPVTGVSSYMVNYRFEDNNITSNRVSSPDFEIFNSQVGTYQISVFSLSADLQASTTSSDITFNALGKTELPGDVQNLFIEPISDQFVRLRFDKSIDVDVIHGGNVVVRSSNLTSGATFTNAVDVIPALPGSINETIVPNIVNGTYLVKFKDDGGRLSAGEASVVMIQTEPDVLPKLTILSDREDLDTPPFQGFKDDCFFSDEVDGLVLGSTAFIDDVADFDAIADVDFLGDVDKTGGSYDFANTLDLGGSQPLIVRRHIVSQGFYPNDLIDKRTGNVDTWTDFDGATAFDVNAKLLVATTQGDPDATTSATYAQSGTTITITKSSHGYSVGAFVTVDFTTGTTNELDGFYEIKTVPNANTFTLTSTTSQTTSGNCTFSAEFSQFNPFVNGVYVARGFKFKCEMTTDDPAQSIEVDQLGYTAAIQSRTETSLGNAGAAAGGHIASGTSTKSVTFTNSFFTGQSGTSVAANSVLPSIGITIENAQQGDFFALSSITGTGFDIDVKDSGGNNVNRNFKYAATGFGRGS